MGGAGSDLCQSGFGKYPCTVTPHPQPCRCWDCSQVVHKMHLRLQNCSKKWIDQHEAEIISFLCWEKMKVKLKSLSRVWLFETPCTVAYQAPQSTEFSKQEYWSGLPFPSPGDLPNPGIEPRSPALQADALPSEPPGKPHWEKIVLLNYCTDWVRGFCFFFKTTNSSLKALSFYLPIESN